jgi:CO/xanthine dehydrogenase FAD-binding subunit
MDILVPRSLEEALELKARRPEAVPVAGGTDLMIELNAGRARPPALLDLSRIQELRTWGRENGTVCLGAGVTFGRISDELRAFTALAEAARSVGSAQIRARATIGGNLATASPAGDGVAVLAAYDAAVVAARAGATRKIPVRDFLVGPKRSSLAPDELITGVEWRVADGPGSFAKVGPRSAIVIAIASVCLQADGDDVRLALGSVAPTVIRAPEAERLAAAHGSSGDFGRLAAAAARPIDDLRGTAAYRRHTVEVLARRALARAREEPC